MKIKKAKLNIPNCWRISCYNLTEIQPDNNLPIDVVWDEFTDDLFHANFENYFIDIGFSCGPYTENRSGFYSLYVAKGNFNNGILYENFLTRDLKKLKEKTNFHLNFIPSGKIKDLKGFIFDEESSHPDIYSAINNISIKLTNKDYEELAKPKN